MQRHFCSEVINFIISRLLIALKTFVYDQLPHLAKKYFRALSVPSRQLYCSTFKITERDALYPPEQILAFSRLPAILCFSFSLAVQLGAEGVTSWESVLCGPQHQNHNLGETTATGVRLKHFGFCMCVCVFSP